MSKLSFRHFELYTIKGVKNFFKHLVSYKKANLIVFYNDTPFVMIMS